MADGPPAPADGLGWWHRIVPPVGTASKDPVGVPVSRPDRLGVTYCEDRDTERVIANATELVEVRGDAETVVTAATYVEDHGFTPFDALHLVDSEENTVVSSDDAYDGFAPRLDLREE